MEKMPFYMTYPIQNLYLAEMEYEKDMERMKELYPKEVSTLQKMIELRCDELEQEGSRMYDENPDRLMMSKEAKRIYEAYTREHPEYHEQLHGMQEKKYSFLPPEELAPWLEDVVSAADELSEQAKEDTMLAQTRRGCDGSWLCHLIHVMFDNEVYRRRCRHRRCHRWQM